MSLDIIFQKRFTIEDVENKTSIKIEFKNNNYWMCKNDSRILIVSDIQTEMDVERFKVDGFEIIMDNNEMFALKDDVKCLIRFDMGKKNIVNRITQYGMNDLSEIMDELVFGFQTKFITDIQMDMLYDGNCDISDICKLYDDTTKLHGYKIENNIIS